MNRIMLKYQQMMRKSSEKGLTIIVSYLTTVLLTWTTTLPWWICERGCHGVQGRIFSMRLKALRTVPMANTVACHVGTSISVTI